MNLELLLKFSIVGCIGVGTNFFITWVLKDVLNSKKYFSNAIGYSIAMTLNFIGNKDWTFSSNDESIYTLLLKFLLVVSLGILFNHLIVFYFHDKIKFNFYFAKILAVGLVFLWNFSMHTYFTFNYFKYF